MISPEQAQKLSDLRSRMLENIKHNRPSHEGITEDEIKEGLSFIRANRAAAVEKSAKSKKSKKAPVQVDLGKFAGLNLD